jgi:hypothetical protein
VRPTQEQLLRSVRESLSDVVIPNVDDSWARYVAKGMEKILLHLEQRAAHEHEFLVRDTIELRALFTALASDEGLAAAGSFIPLAADLRDTLDQPALAEGDPPDALALLEENERHRALLVDVINVVEARDADTALAAVRESVRAMVRDELERDLELARPTFMLFGPPSTKAAAK